MPIVPGQAHDLDTVGASTRLSTGVDKPQPAGQAQDRSTIGAGSKMGLATCASALAAAVAARPAQTGSLARSHVRLVCAPARNIVFASERPPASKPPGPAEEDPREAHIPAQQPPASQAPRVPRPHVDPRRPRGPEEPSRQGPRPPVGLIHRIRGRDAFRRLAHDGTRIRRPALWCTWCPDPSTSTISVAFAIGRALGPAVRRNQLRRRLRAILRELEPSLQGGLLLIGANPSASELTFDQLRTELQELLTRAMAAPPRSQARAQASSRV